MQIWITFLFGVYSTQCLCVLSANINGFCNSAKVLTVMHNNSCFYYDDSQPLGSFTSGSDFCNTLATSNGFQGRVAWIPDDATWSAIAPHLKKIQTNGDQLWIGLSTTQPNTQTQWWWMLSSTVQGSQLSLPSKVSLSISNNNYACVYMTVGGTVWNDDDCSANHGVLCELFELPSTTTVTTSTMTTTSSSTTTSTTTTATTPTTTTSTTSTTVASSATPTTTTTIPTSSTTSTAMTSTSTPTITTSTTTPTTTSPTTITTSTTTTTSTNAPTTTSTIPTTSPAVTSVASTTSSSSPITTTSSVLISTPSSMSAATTSSTASTSSTSPGAISTSTASTTTSTTGISTGPISSSAITKATTTASMVRVQSTGASSSTVISPSIGTTVNHFSTSISTATSVAQTAGSSPIPSSSSPSSATTSPLRTTASASTAPPYVSSSTTKSPPVTPTSQAPTTFLPQTTPIANPLIPSSIITTHPPGTTVIMSLTSQWTLGATSTPAPLTSAAIISNAQTVAPPSVGTTNKPTVLSVTSSRPSLPRSTATLAVLPLSQTYSAAPVVISEPSTTIAGAGPNSTAGMSQSPRIGPTWAATTIDTILQETDTAATAQNFFGGQQDSSTVAAITSIGSNASIVPTQTSSWTDAGPTFTPTAVTIATALHSVTTLATAATTVIPSSSNTSSVIASGTTHSVFSTFTTPSDINQGTVTPPLSSGPQTVTDYSTGSNAATVISPLTASVQTPASATVNTVAMGSVATTIAGISAVSVTPNTSAVGISHWASNAPSGLVPTSVSSNPLTTISWSAYTLTTKENIEVTTAVRNVTYIHAESSPFTTLKYKQTTSIEGSATAGSTEGLPAIPTILASTTVPGELATDTTAVNTQPVSKNTDYVPAKSTVPGVTISTSFADILEPFPTTVRQIPHNVSSVMEKTNYKTTAEGGSELSTMAEMTQRALVTSVGAGVSKDVVGTLGTNTITIIGADGSTISTQTFITDPFAAVPTIQNITAGAARPTASLNEDASSPGPSFSLSGGEITNAAITVGNNTQNGPTPSVSAASLPPGDKQTDATAYTATVSITPADSALSFAPQLAQQNTVSPAVPLTFSQTAAGNHAAPTDNISSPTVNPVLDTRAIGSFPSTEATKGGGSTDDRGSNSTSGGPLHTRSPETVALSSTLDKMATISGLKTSQAATNGTYRSGATIAVAILNTIQFTSNSSKTERPTANILDSATATSPSANAVSSNTESKPNNVSVTSGQGQSIPLITDQYQTDTGGNGDTKVPMVTQGVVQSAATDADKGSVTKTPLDLLEQQAAALPSVTTPNSNPVGVKEQIEQAAPAAAAIAATGAPAAGVTPLIAAATGPTTGADAGIVDRSLAPLATAGAAAAANKAASSISTVGQSLEAKADKEKVGNWNGNLPATMAIPASSGQDGKTGMSGMASQGMAPAKQPTATASVTTFDYGAFMEWLKQNSTSPSSWPEEAAAAKSASKVSVDNTASAVSPAAASAVASATAGTQASDNSKPKVSPGRTLSMDGVTAIGQAIPSEAPAAKASNATAGPMVSPVSSVQSPLPAASPAPATGITIGDSPGQTVAPSAKGASNLPSEEKPPFSQPTAKQESGQSAPTAAPDATEATDCDITFWPEIEATDSPSAAHDNTDEIKAKASANDFPMSDVEKLVATIMRILGCVYIVALLSSIIFIFQLLLRDYSFERLVHLSQEGSLLLAHIVLLCFGDRLGTGASDRMCKVAAVLCQLFFTTTAAFQLVEALQIHSIYTNSQFSNGIFVGSRLYVFTAGFGLPIVITIASVTILHGPDSFVGKYTCWLNMDSNASKAVIIPIGCFVGLSAIMLEAAALGITHRYPTTDQHQWNTAMINHGGLAILLITNTAAMVLGMITMHYQRLAWFTLTLGMNVANACVIFFFHAFSEYQFRCFLRRTFSCLAKGSKKILKR